MVNKKLLAISYCCAFLFVYLCNIAYAIVPPLFEKSTGVQVKLPQNTMTYASYNATISSVSSLGETSSLFVIIIVVTIIGFVLFSSFGFMRRAL